jgi:hypothetical protein
VKTTGFCCHPTFLQRLLQVDDDLAAVGKSPASAVRWLSRSISLLLSAVATQFSEKRARAFTLLKTQVGHYNSPMIF